MAGTPARPSTMISPKDKAKVPKDSMTLLPCFYFVEVGVGWVGGCRGGAAASPLPSHPGCGCASSGLLGARPRARPVPPGDPGHPAGGSGGWGGQGAPTDPPRPPQLPIVASSIVTLYFLELTDLFKPAKVGFQCYDRALSMPYVETNEELIPLLMLLSLAFAAPAASVRPGPIPLPGGGSGGAGSCLGQVLGPL